MQSLVGRRTLKDLEGQPKSGASWEGFVLEQVIHRLAARVDECFFWATHGGAELDLLVVRGQQQLGFEIKRTTSPQVTPSMRSALSDLRLRSLDVIHAGETSFPMDKKIRAVAFRRLLQDIKRLT